MELIKNGIYSTNINTNSFNKYAYFIILNKKDVKNSNGDINCEYTVYYYEFAAALTNENINKILKEFIINKQLLYSDCLIKKESVLIEMIDGYLGKIDNNIGDDLRIFYDIK